MPDVLAFANLVAWNLQIVLLTIVCAVLALLLKIGAPVVRHACARILLVLCLVLPALQPWRAATAVASVSLAPADVSLSSGIAGTSSTGNASAAWARSLARAVRTNWLVAVTVVVATGVALRLAWLAAGILQLRRLRRTGQRLEPDEKTSELAALIEAGAEIRTVARVGQPVTFGLLKPIVLLPEEFASLPVGVQRAVLAHELWHVRRRDWSWVLLEEIVRAAFWFNPAMWWLVSRVQTSREEVVDELTVLVTNSRKSYMEALLAFADKPVLFPATPFARRRHLFDRLLLISTEGVMSSTKIATSTIALAAVACLTAWAASSAFPLVAVADRIAQQSAAASNTPPRDRRPGEAGPETTVERNLKNAIAAAPEKMVPYIQLAKLQEDRGASTEAEATLQSLRAARPQDPHALQLLASFYNRTGQFEKAVNALEDAAAMNPSDPQGYHLVSTMYWEKANRDARLTPVEKLGYIKSGVASSDRALQQDPNFVEAMVYKNLLLRMEAQYETNAATQRALIAEADTLRNRAMELRKTQPPPASQMQFVPAPGQSAPPPPPPPAPPPLTGQVDGVQAVRIGGSIKPPTKVTDVKPVYPEIAKSAAVQGVVILEITVDTLGRVGEARVLRSIPLLDEAALDAVRQWVFTPTLLNGQTVPVIMTVTVNFSLQ
jgi:TonB family protein